MKKSFPFALFFAILSAASLFPASASAQTTRPPVTRTLNLWFEHMLMVLPREVFPMPSFGRTIAMSDEAFTDANTLQSVGFVVGFDHSEVTTYRNLQSLQELTLTMYLPTQTEFIEGYQYVTKYLWVYSTFFVSPEGYPENGTIRIDERDSRFGANYPLRNVYQGVLNMWQTSPDGRG